MRELTDFEHFFKENYSKFYYFALRYIDDREVCRDIVSDAFEYAWKSYKNDEIENWKNYIYSFIRNECIDYIRHLAVHKKYAELLGEHLSQTDFEIGRPIELNAEIFVFEKGEAEIGCRVRLDLPRDPRTAARYLVENQQIESDQDIV